MSTDPTKNFDMNNLEIDELASRLIDHDLELSEIPLSLRTAVEVRAAQFGENRQQLLTSLPLVDSSIMNNAVQRALAGNTTQSKTRKVSMYIASFAAAAAVVAIVGVAVIRSSSSERSTGDIAETAKISTDVMAAPMATEAPAEMSANSFAPMAADSALAGATDSLILRDTNELQDLVSEWSVEGFVVPQKSDPLCDDPLRPAIEIEATFAGQPAEIHFSVRDGIVVYRLDTCDMMGGIVP